MKSGKVPRGKSQEKVRRNKDVPGTLRRGPGGEVIMDLVEGTTDLGAPEFNVTGVARIERISPGQVRVSKYSRRPDGNYITHHEVWDYEVWQKAVVNYGKTMDIIIRAGFSDGGGDSRRAH